MILLAISCLLLLALALSLAFALALVAAVADQMAVVADVVAVAAVLVSLALVAVVVDQMAHVVADQVAVAAVLVALVAVAALGQVAVAAAVVLHLKNLDHFVAVAVVAVVPQILLAEVVSSRHCGMQGTWPSSKTYPLATIRVPWLHRMGLSLCPVLYSMRLHCTAT